MLIIYNNNGTDPSYYKGTLRIYKEDKFIPYENGYWQIITEDAEGLAPGYYPRIRTSATGESEVVATNIYYGNGTYFNKKIALQYVEDVNEDSFVRWTQPLYIGQNKWPSAMLNKWDGTLQIDEEGGTILSQMVGAGYKDAENKFNGVLMGDVELALNDNAGNKTLKKNTGLYGFNGGVPSFGFLDDGTAFLGKSGRGQILLDGNKSTIQSSNYKYGTGDSDREGFESKSQGMCIDLDDGWIDVRGSNYEKELDDGQIQIVNNQSQIKIDSRENQPSLKIISESGNPLLLIGGKEKEDK